ncbi:putative F-box domain, FBD domain, leucine-rich repeat domain superfamily [Helianthus debilis subsp. tardiflorus]
MKVKRPTKAQRLSSTTINTLPQTIIENILCLLPIQEAARTSILSREWRNHAVKKLKLAFNHHMFSYKLPLCAFSMHQLTDLDLRHVDIDHQPIFSGFGSLRSLRLFYVKISTKALLHLLSNCPSLKRFSLGFIDCKDCTIVELFECLPVIEHLTIYGEPLVLDSVPNELPTSLIHLKYLCFNELYFGEDHGLIFLLILVKCSPNLEKIELDIAEGIGDDNGTWFGILEKYSDVRLEHLKELEIHYFSNLKHEMKLVTVILARSPKLKKVIIHSLVEKDEESDMLKILLQAPRASPVEIVVRSMID